MNNSKEERPVAGAEWAFDQLYKMVERLCNEAHMGDDDIAEILRTQDREKLEIISDTATEVLVKAQALIVEARLHLQQDQEGEE